MTNSPWNGHGYQVLFINIKQHLLRHKMVYFLKSFNKIATKSLMTIDSCLVHGVYLLDYTVWSCRENKMNGQGDLLLTGPQRHWTRPSATSEGMRFSIYPIAPLPHRRYFKQVGNLNPTKENKLEEHNQASRSYVATRSCQLCVHGFMNPILHCIHYVHSTCHIIDKSKT